MAKKVNPSNLVRAVRFEGKKNLRYFVKGAEGYTAAKRSEAVQALRDAGLKTTETIQAMGAIAADPYSSVKETKKGLTFAR